MNLNDVLTLARAGFTAGQIQSLLNAPQGASDIKEEPAVTTDLSPSSLSAVPEAAPPMQPAPAAAAVPPTAAAPEHGLPQMRDPGNAELIAAVRSLEQTIRTGNITNSRQPEPPSVDDILAQIINPL